MTYLIEHIKAREVLDSRGNPTVEVELLSNNVIDRFIVPSGASTGQYEAVELRDSDYRYMGKGVQKAINNVNNVLAPKLIGHEITDHNNIDQIMIDIDNTENKANLGANAILGVSISAVKVAARLQNQYLFQYLGNNLRLPCPMLNVINGGEHAGGDLAIQEFMLMPTGFDTFKEALRAGTEVYHNLKKYLIKKYGPQSINVGDEGGFAPPIKKSEDAIDALISSINDAGYSPIDHFHIGIDAAASEFYNNGFYSIDGLKLKSNEMVTYYQELLEKYPILLSLEDPFDENDFESFSNLISSHSSKNIVGDDLTVTNINRINSAIQKNSMNYLLLKVNQIGTFTEAKKAFDLTKSQNWGVIISHRSGETEDTFISDLAVGWGAECIKTGAPARSERVAKYNQLLRIEEILGDGAEYSDYNIVSRN